MVFFNRPTKLFRWKNSIWQKAFIMERERFDGADIAHLFLKCGARIDWEHLFRSIRSGLAGSLVSHLLLFADLFILREKIYFPGT